MATDAPAPTKSFIIKHMNTNHADTLSLYLRAYCGVSAHFAHPAVLQDISLSDLLISAKGTRYSVPINPPMTSFSEARARVVAMHKDSLQRLGLSDITIADNFLPGSVFYETVGLDRYPVLTRFCYDVAPVVVGLLLGVHLVEATLLAVKRLRPHGVRVASGLWVAWIVSNFVEGFPVWRRFDEMVREERMKRERSE
ncbi:DUF2470 domain-containing protein [Aspergillus novofumigatus IBT 16806]|uniref:Putative integral membrane protein n=1 Tax=Aspergillus novofumigatus (strain IBT 16806) TaxID=1392255 RepID=A0A2I1BW57_ASPN1|nr:putative integral membrane protein [Aspergillus novofumigatus IBT 16806]PKX89531.1 putative integral membrane protein [Aspergillus novofumigatus IBT 16806]